MSEERPGFEITRYEVAERTEYRVGTRSFTLNDLSLDAYDEIMVRLEKLLRRVVEAYNDEKKPRTVIEFVRLVIKEGGAEIAGVWNFAFDLAKGDRIDAKWFRRNITIPRLKKIWQHVVKDNGWESMAKAVEEKLFPFVVDIAKMKMAQAAAVAPLPEQDSTTT